tara:strand:+ start:496 stop:1167 length:672 start_codon:yes stop_codon:yes gene_type:complete
MEESKTGVIVSFPRSGNTLLRFLVEYITERVVADYNTTIPSSAIKFYSAYSKSIGETINIEPKNPPILRKYHLVDKNLGEKNLICGAKVNLIIRNPFECINSHIKRSGGRHDDWINSYCDIIRYFDGYENKGVLIYYDNLIDLDKQKFVISSLLSVNNIDEQPNWRAYIDNIKDLNSTSKQGYIDLYKTVQYNHQESFKKEFFEKVRKNLGDYLFLKYLKRYQ